jgi:hypothetical protein
VIVKDGQKVLQITADALGQHTIDIPLM